MFLRLLIVAGSMLLVIVLAGAMKVMGASPTQRAIVHLVAGEELLAAGCLWRAEREFQRALRSQPLLAAAHYALGRLRLEQRRFDEAVDEFERAIAVLGRLDIERGRLVPAVPPAALVDALMRARNRRAIAGDEGRQSRRLVAASSGGPPARTS